MDMGAVGALRRVKNAIGVARDVLLHTKHSLLVGDQATEFAIEMGYLEESLSTNNTHLIWKEWKEKNCQPNFWKVIRFIISMLIIIEFSMYFKDVFPDNKRLCGPYKPISENSIYYQMLMDYDDLMINDIETNHDTIGMVVIDRDKNVVAGTSTNGLKHKIPG